MGKKTLYSRKNTCSKYLGLTHNRAYLFTGNLNTIILPKETPNAAYEQYCNSEFNLQQKMLFGASFDRHRVYGGNYHWIVKAAVWGQVFKALHIKRRDCDWMGYSKYSSFLKDFIIMKPASLNWYSCTWEIEKRLYTAYSKSKFRIFSREWLF